MSQPDMTATSVEALLALLRRRRLFFELMTGTVAPVDAAAQISSSGFVTNPARIGVILDGDTVSVNAQSLVGPPVMGTRVPVLYVPPTGYYVIGFLDVVPGTPIYYEQVTALTVSTIALTEQVIYTTSKGQLGNGLVLFKTGHAYFVNVWSEAHCAVAQNPASFVRTTDLAGQILLGGPRIQLPAGNLDVDYQRHGYVVNLSGADILKTLAVTLTLQSANAVSWGTTTGTDRYIEVVDKGDASQYPGALALT